jgi:hypothetical protein
MVATTQLAPTIYAPPERPIPRLDTGADGRLVAAAEEGPRTVVARRCFPWSEPGKYVSLRDGDHREVALVRDPGSLCEDSRRALDLALAEGGFVFEVSAVIEVEEEVEIRHWQVVTRQGARSFQTRLDDWPRALPGGGFLIRDVGGDLYRLPEPERMDARSRKLLWAFVG